jgi:hypothetical protein
LNDLAAWARDLGFKALQIPVSDPRLKDLAGLSEKDAVIRIEALVSKTGLAISEIAAQRSGQLLAVHPAYDETMDILASPEVRGRPAERQAQAEQDLRRAIARAVILGSIQVGWPGRSFIPTRQDPTASSNVRSTNSHGVGARFSTRPSAPASTCVSNFTPGRICTMAQRSSASLHVLSITRG